MSLLFRPRRPPVCVARDPAAELERLSRAFAGARFGDDSVFSDVEFSSDTEVVNGTGCAEWVVTAVHTGPFVDGEHVVDPTGGRVTVRGVTMAEFSCGGIRTLRHYWDELARLDGLGLLPRD